MPPPLHARTRARGAGPTCPAGAVGIVVRWLEERAGGGPFKAAQQQRVSGANGPVLPARATAGAGAGAGASCTMKEEDLLASEAPLLRPHT